MTQEEMMKSLAETSGPMQVSPGKVRRLSKKGSKVVLNTNRGFGGGSGKGTAIKKELAASKA